MKNRASYSIPTLLAAGLVPVSASAAADTDGNVDKEASMFDGLKSIISGIEESHTYTLAQHRSHYSHASHGSHRSHRSASYRNPPAEEGSATFAPTAYSGSRNELSTPPSSVLPSSPAIAKKLKVLPGNTAKFQEFVTRVQLALASRGYDVGSIDGQMHARTIAAIYQYQQDRGMVPTGKITNDVLGSLAIVAQ